MLPSVHTLTRLCAPRPELTTKPVSWAPPCRKIVKRRRAFEYALRRRQTQKTDFLKYLQYELNVEALRKRRKKIRHIQRKHNCASEFSIVKRIHFTFKVRRAA